MARDKKRNGVLATAATGTHAKARHKRDRKGNAIDWAAPMPPGLVAIPDKPQLSKKYKTWYEAVENKDKKKRLEFEFTQNRQPPPGMEFVPTGNPALTTLCKELSRERDAMIFIVTVCLLDDSPTIQVLTSHQSSAGVYSVALSFHLNRVGHHFRESIVEEARRTLGDDQLIGANAQLGLPEPIPERQEDITRQADAAIRDLFPRIPHTDRQMILDHAFNKARVVQNKESAPVGLAADITLSRRVQLAVLAHIRHNHTRYDQLLRETSWVNARKAVESLCLDYLVKWRGDEETGRDQLDEILYEVIVISDSESDDEDDEHDDEDDSSDTSVADDDGQQVVSWQPPSIRASQPRTHHHTVLPATRAPTEQPRGDNSPRVARTEGRAIKKNQQKDRKAAKWAQRGFSRYQAARDVAWNQAVERQRLEPRELAPSAVPTANGRSASHGPLRIEHPARLGPDFTTSHIPQEPMYYQRPSIDQHNGGPGPVGRPVYMDVAQRISAAAGNHRPVVGSQPYPYRQVEQASHYHGQDPKDHVLQSIEPASPTRFHVPQSSAVAGPAPMRYITNGTDTPHSRLTEPQGYRTLGADEGFVRLPPRADRGRMPNEPIGSSLHPLRTYPGNVPRHDSGVLFRSEAKPIYVEDNGLVRRSEARPIYIEGTPAPTQRPWTESMQPQPDTRSFAIRGAADVRLPGPADGGRHNGRYADDRFQPMDHLRTDFIEIVRVSNNFPRQHELSPIPVDRREFDARLLPGNAQSRRIERVVAIERPGYAPEYVSRVPTYEQADFIRLPPRPERHERVIGLEYRPAHPGYERAPIYEVDHSYQSRTVDDAMPYPGSENQQPRFVRQVPRHGEVITID
ncbi:hypothetical protein QBC40DRAFT_41348 [Triangularia verruculosa]|uniref:DUF2293 domain-containing protein n=1 Tax=Triangularia verruculosa TaxID=2587418 RepID=A0AAN6XQB7_9PEZI|nr:hypothetical protein QBC40DRAFT_41348 [Triangularia verruculosa]